MPEWTYHGSPRTAAATRKGWKLGRDRSLGKFRAAQAGK